MAVKAPVDARRTFTRSTRLTRVIPCPHECPPLTSGEGGGDGFGDAAHQNLNSKALVPYTEQDFRDEFMSLDPEQFVDLLAMAGKVRVVYDPTP